MLSSQIRLLSSQSNNNIIMDCSPRESQIINNNSFQALSKSVTIENHGWYMDYDNEPNSLNVSIWTQLNGYGRIFNDIGCNLVVEHRINKNQM